MILRWLFPLKCSLCGEIIDAKTPRLCSDCQAKWSEEVSLCCPVCGRTASSCRCPVPEIRKLPIPDEKLPFLTAGWYDQKRSPVNAKLVYRLKHAKSDAPAWIFANALAGPVFAYLKAENEAPDQWEIVFPPRTDEAIRREGFDQAERLAKRLARLLGTKSLSVFRRQGGKVQKKLGKSERSENAKESLILKRTSRVNGKKLILCDDVVTTGATTARCIHLLYRAGADKVLTISALRTPPRKGYVPPEKPFWV